MLVKGKEIRVFLYYNVNQWAKFLSENRYKKEDKTLNFVIFDFSEITFIMPHHLVSLACLIEEYYLKKVQIKFVYKKGGLAGEYLANTNFYNFWTGTDERNKYITETYDSTLRLWKIDKHGLDAYANYYKNYFEKHFLQDKELLPISIAVSETCNNVFDHAKSNAGAFILTQYYKKKRAMVVSICDFGVGIPKRINDFRRTRNENKLNHCEAIEKSLENKYTTGSFPHNAGYGLNTIASSVKSTKGELLIVSKKGVYKYKHEESVQKENIDYVFPGTHLVITFPTPYLETKENESSDIIDIL